MQPKNKDNWKSVSMTLMSFAMVTNLAFLMAILQRNIVGYSFYKLKLPFLPSDLNNIVSYFLLIILPVVAVNYLLIFRKNRYEKLLERYPYYNGRLFITYLLISLLTPIVLLWAGIIYYRWFSA